MDIEKTVQETMTEKDEKYMSDAMDLPREKKDYYMRVIVVQLLLCLVFTASLTAIKKVNAESFETLKTEYNLLMAEDGNPVGKAVKDFFTDTLAVKAAAMGNGIYSEQNDEIDSLVTQRLETQIALNSYGREISVVIDSKLTAQDVGITEKAYRPVGGEMTSPFGYRTHPITGKDSFHAGIDLDADEGDPIGAAFDGVVLETGVDSSFGNYIVVKHSGGIKTLYAHCKSIEKEKGESVSSGETIALVGSTGQSTGYHLHFELRIGENNIRLNPEIIIEV